MNDREAALVEAFKALLAERFRWDQRFALATDEDGKGWSFGVQNLTALVLRYYVDWTQGKQKVEPTPAMHKLVGAFLDDILNSNKPGPLITPYRRVLRGKDKNPPKADNVDMVRGVAFFKRHHCEIADAVRLTALALGLQDFQHARIRKAYKDNKDKGLDAIDIMLEQADKPRHWR